MKIKFIAFCLAGVLFGSCSAESTEEKLNLTADGCEYDVTGLYSWCDNGACIYTVSYTGADGKEITVDANQSTFDYYDARLGESDVLCWEGPK